MELSDETYDTRTFMDCLSKKTYSQILASIVKPDYFFENVFEKHPAVYRANDRQANYQQIFSKSAFSMIISSNELYADENVRAYKYVDYNRVDHEFEEDIISVSVVEQIFKSKNSIQFFQPQRFSDELHVINAGFEHVFGSLAGASAYLTPAHSQGLAPHHDDVCVFVIQTEGSKVWHLWQSEIELPETHSADIARESLPSHRITVTLECGDVMYLPRGVIHEAEALGGFSTHVTVSVYQKYNMKALLLVALERVLDESALKMKELRMGLPIRISDLFGSYVGASLDDRGPETRQQREEFLARVRELLKRVVDEVSSDVLDASVDAIVEDFVRNRLPPPPLPPAPKNRKRKGNEEDSDLHASSRVRIFDPHCSHYEVIEMDGMSMLSLATNVQNDRLRHMGHPAEDTAICFDRDIDEENDNEVEEENGTTLCLDLKLLPMVRFLELAYNVEHGVEISSIQSACVKRQIGFDEIMDGLHEMLKAGLLEIVF